MTLASLEGQTLGKYRVMEPLGRGGMARVYRAYHPQLDRYVAIKVLRSELVEEEEFLARFRREARAVAALRHPNIVQVFDFDVQDDVYYMVIELLEGDTLKARLNEYRMRGEPMPLGEVTRILLDVLDGLAYAHGEGMVHRDVKPANIMLTRRGQAVLTDFGIAQIIGGTRYTVSGALMGTLNYMAPEQGLEGRGDARSDIYSLGIVLYEMFTGRTPFDADTPLAILMKHVNDPLPLPRQSNPNIPASFERIILKALAKHPADRYQSAADMAQTLGQAASEAQVELPERISLPLSFTTPAAPAEPVAVFSGTARQKIADAQFAAEDTDTTLSKKLAAGQAPSGQAGDNVKELVSAAGTLGQVVAGKTARALRQAVDAIEGEAAQPSPEAASAQPAGDEAVLSVPTEAGGDHAGELVSAVGALGQIVAGKTAQALRGAVKAMEDPSQARSMEAAPADAPAAGIGTARGLQASPRSPALGWLLFAGALMLLILCNTSGMFVSHNTDWNVFARGWPVELFLAAAVLFAIMSAAGSIWLLIPAGLVLGNGLLLAYYTLTGHWWHWAFLWPLEPALLTGVIVLTVRLVKRGDRARPLSRFLGWSLGLVSLGLGLVVGMVTLIVIVIA